MQTSIPPEIVSYIESERSRGTSDTAIKSNLLANGWSDKEVADAMRSGTIPAIDTSVKKYRNGLTWNIFSALVALDALIIIVSHMVWGIYGIFGISLYSILIRLFVIYVVSLFAARGAKVETKKSKAVINGVARALSAVLMAVFIGAGVIFVGCLFIFSGLR